MNLLNKSGLFIACAALACCATLTPKNDTKETGSAAGIPAITYEVGDNTDRKALAQTAEIFA